MNVVRRLVLVALVLFPVYAFGQSADQQIVSVTDSPDPVVPGQNVTYTVTYSNNGPDAATNGGVNILLDPNLTHVMSTVPPGFTCFYLGNNGTCSLASATPATHVLTIVATVSPTLLSSPGGSLVSQFFTSGVTPDPNNANNAASVTTTYVSPQADMTVTASDSPDPVFPDGDITYTVTVGNAGPDAATNAVLNVPLNNTLRFTSIAVPAGWSCSPPAPGAGTSFSCTAATFSSGGSAAFTIVLRANDEQFGNTDQTIVQNFNVDATEYDSNGGNSSVNVSTAYATPDADLSVSASDSPDPVIPGFDITYSGTISNAGPDAASSVELTIPLDSRLLFRSLTTSPGLTCTTPAVDATGTVTCSVASLAAAANATFTLVTRLDPSTAGSGSVAQDFLVESATSDPDLIDNSASVTTSYPPAAQLFVFHLDGGQEVPPVSTPGVRGGCVAYFDSGASSLSLTCMHNVATATLMHVHRGAPGVTGPVVFDLGDPASPVTAVWTAMTPADVADLLAGNFYVNIHTPGHPAGEIRGQILPRTVDTIAFALTGSQVVPADATTATGNCTADLNNAATALALACTHDLAGATDGHLHLGDVGVDGPVIHTFASPSSPINENVPLAPLHVAAFAGNFLYAELHAPANAIRGQIGAAPPAADLVVTKTTSTTSAPRGGSVTYTITLTNNGPDSATSVVMTDVLPAQLLFQSITAPAGFSCTTPATGVTGTVTCTAASLANGASATFTLVTTIAAAASGPVLNSATAAAAEPDTNPANSTQAASAVAVVNASDLAITKSVSSTTAAEGSMITYTITVRNDGPDPATNVVVTDVLDAGLRLVTATAGAGTCSGTSTIQCNVGALGVGQSATIALVVQVVAQPGGVVPNSASASATEPDTDPADNVAAAANVAVTAAPVVPTLSEWALLLLAAFLAGAALAKTA